YYLLNWVDNLAVASCSVPAACVASGDWTPFPYTAPPDPRLNGGGSEQITLYNLNPALVGVKNNFLTNSSDYRDYNGLEATANVKLPKQAFLFTSVTAGKTHTYACTGGGVNPNGGAQDNPNNLRYCDQTTPFRYIFKLSGGLPLRYKHHHQRQLPDLRRAGGGPLPGAAVLCGRRSGQCRERRPDRHGWSNHPGDGLCESPAAELDFPGLLPHCRCALREDHDDG